MLAGEFWVLQSEKVTFLCYNVKAEEDSIKLQVALDDEFSVSEGRADSTVRRGGHLLTIYYRSFSATVEENLIIILILYQMACPSNPVLQIRPICYWAIAEGEEILAISMEFELVTSHGLKPESYP